MPPPGIFIRDEELMPPEGFLSSFERQSRACKRASPEVVAARVAGCQEGRRNSDPEAPTKIAKMVLKPNIEDRLVDLIISYPGYSRRDLAELIGRSDLYIYKLMSTDRFKTKLAARKAELIDPLLLETIAEQLEAMAALSAEIVMEKLSKSRDADFALRTLTTSTKALGYGASPAATQAVNFVVQMPPPVSTSQDWETLHGPDRTEGQSGAVLSGVEGVTPFEVA